MNLEENCSGEEDAKAICEELTVNRTLKTLYYSTRVMYYSGLNYFLVLPEKETSISEIRLTFPKKIVKNVNANKFKKNKNWELKYFKD